MRVSKLLLAIIVACFVFVPPVLANTIGLTYSQAIDDEAWGVIGDYEHEISDNLKFGLEGQMQASDAFAGNLDMALTIWNNLRLESNNIFQGYVLNDIGRRNDLGASWVFAFGDTEVSFGLFGQNGNPFQPIYELSDPTDPTSAELVDSGILIKDGSTLNLAARFEKDMSVLNRSVEGGFRTLFELSGKEDEDKVHQLTIDLETGGNLALGVTWTAQVQIDAQLQGEEVYLQRTITSGVNYRF